MKRWAVPMAVAATVTAAAVVATLAPAQMAPPAQTPGRTSRVSLLCPSFRSPTTSVTVAAASTGSGLRTAPLSAPSRADEKSGVARLVDAAEPVRVSAPSSEPLGGVTVASAVSGPERGLSAAGCAAPRTEHWFTGVDASPAGQADLVLANMDADPAAVDVTLWSADGRLAAPGSRGLVVAGNSGSTVSLSQLVDVTTPVSLHVETSQGRVVALVRQRQWLGTTPLGAEWVAPVPAPAAQVVIAGVPEGAGSRELVIANPGERTADVRIGVLGTSGRTEIAGLEAANLPPGATRAVDLTAGLDGQAAAVQLDSSQPVTAAIRLTGPGGPERSDPAVLPASWPLGPDALWPIPAPEAAGVVVALANPGSAEATVILTVSNGLGKPGESVEVRVPAGSSITAPVGKTRTPVIRLKTGSSPVYAAAVITAEVERIHGLAVLGLGSDAVSSRVPSVVFDPHAGV